MQSFWKAFATCIAIGCVGCVKIASDQYTVNGIDVNTLVADAGSRGPLVLRRTSVDAARARLGEPDRQYETSGRTDVYVAPEGTRWIFWPMPAAHYKQTLVGRRAVLLRLDYDERGTLQAAETKQVLGLPERAADDAERVWPDLAR